MNGGTKIVASQQRPQRLAAPLRRLLYDDVTGEDDIAEGSISQSSPRRILCTHHVFAANYRTALGRGRRCFSPVQGKDGSQEQNPNPAGIRTRVASRIPQQSSELLAADNTLGPAWQLLVTTVRRNGNECLIANFTLDPEEMMMMICIPMTAFNMALVYLCPGRTEGCAIKLT